MTSYHFKLALRNLRRNKTFSITNILGITIGLASCILIGLYTFNELSFDTFHLQHNNIYRINKITNENSAQAAKDGLTPGQLAPALEKDLPEVVHAARFRPWFNDMLVSHDSLHLKLSNVAYADPTFLEIFDFALLKGNKNTALTAPYSAVITASVAQRFFGNADPIGKTLLTQHDIPVKITGIAKEIPHQSSIQFSILISWATITAPAHADQFFWMNTWTTQANYTFVQLREGTDPVKLGAKVSAMMHKNMPEDEFQYRPYLQSLDDIYLRSSTIQYSDFFKKNNKKVIYILPIIAAFILIIAAFNFINFSTALALSRAKETGVQKILGAQQRQLIGQFFSESFLLCSIAFMLAICIVSILLPGFNNLTNSQLDFVMLLKPAIIVGMGGLLLIISLLAGLYPAVFLSQFKAKDAFRKALKPGNNYLRKSLVTTQFTISIILIIATFGVQQQMQYLFKKDLGFNKEQVLVLELANTSLEAKSPAFITALKQWSGVINITATDQIPGQNFNGFGIIPEGHTLEEHLMANLLQTDANFLKTYDIHLTKGRFFSPDMPTDTTQAIVINEAMVAYLNWKEPINQALEIHETLKGRVIGVIKDFNIASLREKVQPLALILKSNPRYLSIRIKPEDVPATLAFLEKTWQQFEPQYPFEYHFLDEELNQYYRSDVRLLLVLSIFTGLAVYIACMGLFGLSMYTVRQRIKEIGIRKVLGATTVSIISLLSKDTLKLVLIAIFIATPIAWWVMRQWLQEFAYRIELNWWIFVIAGVLAVLIAMLTVSSQAIRAAVANPAESLKSE